MIHPSAIIHPAAVLDPSVNVGPYAIIDEGVQVGPGCMIGPHVYLTGKTTIGARNRFFSGCVIGEGPQDLKYRGAPSGLKIGEGNTFREHVTVHRSTTEDAYTVIGSNNLLMHHSHMAHNVELGNSVILAGGAMLAGHVLVGDRALISGNCLVHQFVRVGTLAMMQGGSAISKDLPPYTVIRENNRICGLNIIGLRRAGFSSADRLALKVLYRDLFRSGRNLRAAVAEAQKNPNEGPCKILLEFLATCTARGVCVEAPRGHGNIPASTDDEGSEESSN